ncbi:MAG: hypothetical protein ACJ72O_07645, partial [Marmoricola sp.]
MSGNEESGAPPEVPEEYAAIYRDAYERALEQDGDPGLAAELLGSSVVEREPAERPAWLVPAGIGAAVVLVLCAFVLGKMLSSDGTTDATGEPTAPTSRVPASTTPTKAPTHKPTPKATPSKTAGAWSGAVAPVAINAVTATCTAPPGTDSSGQAVRYDAGNAADSDATTAWRCEGSAIGTVLTVTL